MKDLKPWRLSGMLTFTRTVGEVALHRNGTMLDIWVRVNGKPVWFTVRAGEVREFLAGDWVPNHGRTAVLHAESDGNAEQ